MLTYRLGAKGPEVARLQARLKELGHYPGPVDGDFGGGTSCAVRVFQKAAGLTPDGIMGPLTWEALFPWEALPRPAIYQEPLAYRCLALTGALETGLALPECFAAVTGDFDGQGLSLGALQWNLGQRTLPPLLKRLNDRHPGRLQEIFDHRYPELLALLEAEQAEQLTWARALQDRRHRVVEPWRGLFKTLGRLPEFQRLQVESAQPLFAAALIRCRELGVWSERAAALLFDIKVQNGSLGRMVRAQLAADFSRLNPALSREDREVARLRLIARRRAAAVHPRWAPDVLTRKLAIANGQGTVHGTYFHLEDQYGIRLEPWAPAG